MAADPISAVAGAIGEVAKTIPSILDAATFKAKQYYNRLAQEGSLLNKNWFMDGVVDNRAASQKTMWIVVGGVLLLAVVFILSPDKD
jgi:hypothetical protein